ncbi:hypothetical protein ACLMJK_000778 [Lecanora helva]
MASESQLPILPHGSASTLRALSETFSFHASPEAFITSRVLDFQSSNKSLAESRIPIRAKVLNRNVAVISSYHHVKKILDDEDKVSTFSASKAYDELMAPFFPPPNLLLTDPPEHHSMKEGWKTKVNRLPSEARPLVRSITLRYFGGFESGSTIDLYESMKELSWMLIISIFCNASEKDAVTLESLQEDLLRGQFSLFPVSLNARVWRSPRSRGLAARKKLQELLKGRAKSGQNGCPFPVHTAADEDDVASHLLLFTSSLAVKSLSSLLTACLLNLFVFKEMDLDAGDSIASNVKSLTSDADRLELLESALLETQRLSPPVVGIMRRTIQEVTLPSDSDGMPDTLIPKDWDTWLYFVGAARDPAVFGETADLFRTGRYYHRSQDQRHVEQGFAFGAGPKSCLGEHLMREVVMTVMSTCLGIDSGNPEVKPRIGLQGRMQDIPKGVQAWLGWQQNVKPEEWAKDMKQLPTQRPSKAVMVKLVHDLGHRSK